MPTGIFNRQHGKRLPTPSTIDSIDRLLIIGTAVDGPLNTPVRVTSQRDLERVFGPITYKNNYKDPNISAENVTAYNGATLGLAYEQALAEGFTNIYLVRATGSYARAASGFTNKMDIKAVNPGSLYNDVTVAAVSGASTSTITLNQPDVKGGSVTFTFNSTARLDYVIDSINSDPRNTTVEIVKESWPSSLSTMVSGLGSATVTLSGGTNGTDAPGEDLELRPDLYALALTAADTGTFDSLEGEFRFSVAVLTGLYVDDKIVTGSTTETIGWYFAEWLDRMTLVSNPCIGVIGTRPTGLTEKSSLISYINNSLLATTAGDYSTAKKTIKAGPFLYNGVLKQIGQSEISDVSWRIVVCAGPDAIYSNSEIGEYKDNIHVSIAAMIAGVNPTESITFKNLMGPVGFSQSIPNRYVELLTNGVGYDAANFANAKGAYVVAVPDSKNPSSTRFMVKDDPTAGPRNFEFNQVQVVNLINSIQTDVTDELYAFIGKPTDAASMAAMKTKVKTILDRYQKAGAFRGPEGVGYTYDVFMSDADELIDAVRVTINVHPARAARMIFVDLSVTRTGGQS